MRTPLFAILCTVMASPTLAPAGIAPFHSPGSDSNLAGYGTRRTGRALESDEAVHGPAADQADGVSIFYGSQRGSVTYDAGVVPGNPFATALIELLDRRQLTLAQIARELPDLTEKRSDGRQQRAAVPPEADLPTWNISPKKSNEKRLALVMVFSSYSPSSSLQSLPGARYDAQRIARALSKAGFEIESPVVDATPKEIGHILADFRDRSATADVALVYTTGHGGEFAGRTYLLPGDFPASRSLETLNDTGIPLIDVVSALAAKNVNLVFYAGCRDTPF